MTRSPHLTREVLNEYETRIMDAFDYLDTDEVYSLIAKDEPVDVFFGSSCYTVSLRNPLQGGASSIFLHGYCTLFAHTFATTHGSDDVLLITRKDDSEFAKEWSGHMVASRVNAEGEREWVDVRGVVLEKNLEREYPTEHYEHTVVTLSEAVEIVISKEHRADPLGFLDELEAAFVRIVVDEVQARLAR